MIRMWGKQAPDPDVLAFLAAAGISDAAIEDALTIFVTGLKSDGLWTIPAAIYPMVGGTSTTCKYNLKDPRDLDAAYRLTFYNSPTIDANGVEFNGTTQHADTYFIPNTHLTGKNAHLCVYNLKNIAYRAAMDIGAIGSGLNSYEMGISFNIPGNVWYKLAQVGNINFAPGTTDERGLFITTRDASNAYLVKNGALVDTVAGAGAASKPTTKIFIGAESNSAGTGALFRSSLKYGYASLGPAFTVAQAIQYSARVNTLMTQLGRNTY